MNKQDLETVKSIVRNIPDFPVPGIQFKDLTTAFKDPKALAIMTEALTDLYRDKGVTKVVGIEARGFIGGATLASPPDARVRPPRQLIRARRSTGHRSGICAGHCLQSRGVYDTFNARNKTDETENGVGT